MIIHDKRKKSTPTKWGNYVRKWGNRKWKHNSKFPYRDKAFLIREYIINKKSCKKIAKEQNTNCKQINYWMHKFDIPFRPHYEYYRTNLIGKKFGRLIVLKEYKGKTESNKKGVKWLCECDCGNTIVVLSRLLIGGNNMSCGKHTYKGYAEISGSHFSKLKRMAESRELKFRITLPYIWKIFLKQNRKCALSGVELFADANILNKETTASLDRIDSSKGYIKGNVQWVHKDLNRCKWDFPEAEFLEWVKKIYHYRIASNDTKPPAFSEPVS